MIAEASYAETDPFERERIVVIDPTSGRRLAQFVRDRFPQLQVTSLDTYLSAIAELCRRPARAVVADVDGGPASLSDAVAGVREAIGPETSFVLSCSPAFEPVARRAMSAGADDYVLMPPEEEELSAALKLAPREMETGDASLSSFAAVGAALPLLQEAVAASSGRPRAQAEKLAEWVRAISGARGVILVVEGTVVTAGEPDAKPVLTFPIPGDGGAAGHLSVGERDQGALPAGAHRDAGPRRLYDRPVAPHGSDSSQVARLALTDEMTGLPNRRYLHERIRPVLARAAAERFPVTVLLFDVDDFKSFNDTFGHDAGDEVLRLVGQLFREHCREHDIVTRYGGDEFAVVFWDAEGQRVAGSKHPETALVVLERFTQALQSQKLFCSSADQQAKLTISGGLATFPWDGAALPALLARADEALLAAKRAGKNRILVVSQAPGE